jgi:hypothetical protein
MATIKLPTPEPEVLLDAFMGDIYNILGLKQGNILRRPAAWLFGEPLLRFCRLFVETDRIMARSGFVDGARHLAMHTFARAIHVRGQENVPSDGPLLVVSNHPGGIDSPSISASLGRQDLKIIASNVLLLRRLPTVSQHLIFIADDVNTRMSVIRESIRYLQTGGALLVFPTGLIDPDPGFMEQSAEVMNSWSDSVEIFLRKVPETRLLPAIASDVLHPAAVNHPLARLQKERWKRQRMAEFLQIIFQLLFPNRLRLEPRISFGPPARLVDLEAESDSRRLKERIIAREKALLEEHWKAFYAGNSPEKLPGLLLR